MNRFLNLAFIAAITIVLAACNKEDDFVPSAEVNKTSLQFSHNGGVDSITITSNVDWTIEKDADWVTLSATSGNSNGVVKVNVDENTVTEPRNTMIIIKVAGLADIKIGLTQSDAPTPNAEVDKTSLTFSYNGGVDSIAITSNVDWTIEKDADADWVALSATSGNSNGIVKINVDENTVTTPRNATITIKVAGLADIKIDLVQSKMLETVGLYILSEGAWGSGTSDILYYDLKTEQITKKFSEANGKPLGDGANDLALYGSKLYCAISGGTEGYIEVINPETGVSIKRISVTKADGTNGSPRRIIFHEGKAYVTTYSQSVIRIDTASLTIDGTANLSGTYAEGICLYNDNFYVCNSGQGSGNTISVVNLASFTETETIDVPQNPTMIEATTSGDIYFTTSDVSWAGGGPSNLHLLNPEKKKVEKTFDVRASKIALAKDVLYAVDFVWGDFSDHIHKINLQTKTAENISNIYDNTTVYSVSVNPLNGDFYLGNQGQNIVAFDKDGKEKFDLKTKIAITATVVPIFK
jgi:hypothetical protein